MKLILTNDNIKEITFEETKAPYVLRIVANDQKFASTIYRSITTTQTSIEADGKDLEFQVDLEESTVILSGNLANALDLLYARELLPNDIKQRISENIKITALVENSKLYGIKLGSSADCKECIFAGNSTSSSSTEKISPDEIHGFVERLESFMKSANPSDPTTQKVLELVTPLNELLSRTQLRSSSLKRAGQVK